MALGRAEAAFEATGYPVAICRLGDYPREHDAWLGNPAVDKDSPQKILDGGGCRPYVKHWQGRRAVYDLTYRARAGRIHLTQEEKDFAAQIKGEFAVVAPTVKSNGSPNKGYKHWEAVIKGFPIRVYQLMEKATDKPIEGAIGLHTPTFRMAAAVIERARLVMCNEGGTHHMAASMRRPAVVIFGAFVPPEVTGYPFHVNISVETPEGYCGNFDPCPHCDKAMETIKPEYVRQKAIEILNG
jgi:hypothetical protein